MTNFIKRNWGALIRISITVAGLVLVLNMIDLRDLWQELVKARPGWVILGFSLVIGGYLIRALRWLILLRGLGVRVSLLRLVELYLIGAFFNSFLPSGFGGDVVRAIEASHDAPPEVATGTVIIDRMTGLLSLFAMALLALLWQPGSLPPTLALQIGLICLVGLIGGLFLLEGSLMLRLSRWLPGPLHRLGHGLIHKILAAVKKCGWGTIAQAIGISILFNLLLIGYWTVGARALDLPVTFAQHIIIVPIWSIMLLVPSIGGLGVREVLAPTLYGALGLTPAEAVALTLLVFAIERLSSLVGAPVYILSTARNVKRGT